MFIMKIDANSFMLGWVTAALVMVVIVLILQLSGPDTPNCRAMFPYTDGFNQSMSLDLYKEQMNDYKNCMNGTFLK